MPKTTSVPLLRVYTRRKLLAGQEAPKIQKSRASKMLISLPQPMRDMLDEIAYSENYDSRTELVRALIRDKIRDYECYLMQKQQSKGILTTD